MYGCYLIIKLTSICDKSICTFKTYQHDAKYLFELYSMTFLPFNILCTPLNCLALMSESMLIIPIPPSSTRKQHTSLFPPFPFTYPTFNPYMSIPPLSLPFCLFHPYPSPFVYTTLIPSLLSMPPLSLPFCLYHPYPSPFVYTTLVPPLLSIPPLSLPFSPLIQGTCYTQNAIKTYVQWSHNIYNELELLAITSLG